MCASDPGRRLLAAMLWCALACTTAHAQGEREQEQVRRLKLQLRQVQQQQDVAVQEAKAQADAAKAAVAQSLKSAQGDAALQRQAANTASRRVRALNDELDALKKDKDQLAAELAQVQKSLLQAKASLAQQQAQAEQAAQALSASQGHGKQASQALAQCVAQNAELVSLGQTLLARYEQKGLGEVMASNEPFLQLSRVKLENFKSSHQDKLDALRAKRAEP